MLKGVILIVKVNWKNTLLKLNGKKTLLKLTEKKNMFPTHCHFFK